MADPFVRPLHSSAGGRPGNKRLAWLATYVFCAKNGVELDPPDDEAYDLVMALAAGQLDDVAAIAEALERWPG